MSVLATFIYFGTFAAALLYSRRRGIAGLTAATIFLIPWFGLQTNIGVTINVDRFVAATLLMALVLKYGTTTMSLFGPFLFYMVADTVAQSVNLPSTAGDYAATKGQWRWLLQLPMWAVLIAPGAALARLASLEVTKNVLRALLFSGVILAAVGIVQVFAFYMTGVDFLPIGIFSGEEMRSGLFGTDDFMGGRVFRASALGGEPKHLAYTLAVCLTVVVGDRLFGDFLGIQRRQFLLVSGVMVAGLTATFSTQGFALLALNSGILLAGAAVMRGSWKRMPAIAVLLVGVLLAAWFIPGLRAVLYDRTFVRMAETGGVEDWNEAVWEWFRVSPYSWPFGVGLGNVHLHASGFVPSESLSYMGGNVFVAKAGILRILSELGIVGLIVFLAALIRPLKVLWVRARRGSSVAGFIGTVTIAIVVDFLISFDGPAYIFLFIGVAAAVARCLSWSQSTQPSTGGAQRAVATS